MKKLLVLLILTVIVYGNENLQEKNIQKQIEKEKKFQEEQKFYQGKDYDLDSFEVDEGSLRNIPKQPDYNEDFDMNDVYD